MLRGGGGGARSLGWEDGVKDGAVEFLVPLGATAG